MNPASIIEDDRLRSQIEFIIEIDKMKNIMRRSLITDGSRRENDSEHSWHLAVMAIILKEYADPGTDLLRVIEMVLVHDLVEIHAGDTFLYDPSAAESKVVREVQAAEKLFGILQDDQRVHIRSLWDEFELAVTPEAMYARALDRLQPVMLNCATGGKTWWEHGVRPEMAMGVNIPIVSRGSQKLGDYVKSLLEAAKEEGLFDRPQD